MGTKKFILYMLAGWFICCKTPQITPLSPTTISQKLPTRFLANADDSLNISLPQWQKIFFDTNLSKLIDSALLNNFDVKMALQKIELSRANLNFSKSFLLPEVGIGANAGLRKFSTYTMDGVGNFDTNLSQNITPQQQIPNPLPDYGLGFQASWELDVWGKLKNRKKSALANFTASAYGKNYVITNLVAEIASTYFQLLALDKEMDILRENIVLQQEALDVVKIKREVGKANSLAVEMLSAQIENTKAIKTEVSQQIIEAQSKLTFLSGTYPDIVERDTSFSNHNFDGILSTGIPTALINNRPDIKQAEMELVATNANIKAAKAAFYPSFFIDANMGLQAFNAQFLLQTPSAVAYNVLGSLSAPLLNRRKIKADLLAANAEQKNAYINYEKQVINSFTEVYNAANNIKNTKEMYRLKKLEVAFLQKAIATSYELFNVGKAGYLEVFLAQQTALKSQIELIIYKKQQNIALVNLYKCLGGGWQ
ncbi:MAG: TolC family protein [Sphingobacteriales bacterium]|nr:MAG: TolC family protein [Sphingobacteriales bacterium]TAF82810.1 MAG: TolC family protein [Sphingobacteriales bacterium]